MRRDRSVILRGGWAWFIEDDGFCLLTDSIVLILLLIMGDMFGLLYVDANGGSDISESTDVFNNVTLFSVKLCWEISSLCTRISLVGVDWVWWIEL